MRAFPLLIILAASCTPEKDLGADTVPLGDSGDDSVVMTDDSATDDSATDDSDEPVETCEDQRPQGGTVGIAGDCEYTPEPSGNPFLATVEWAMTHELVDPATGDVVPAYTFSQFPSLTGVFQAPAVGQATDDDGDGGVSESDTPDVAVIMGDEFGEQVSAVRLISGDGARLHDSIFWETHQGDSYAPYLFAGLAMGDVDADGLTEVVTTVVSDATGLCHAAKYEVSTVGQLSLEQVSGDSVWCAAHAPALGDVDSDGLVDIVLGAALLDGADLGLVFEGSDGRGWYHSAYYGVADGYWNSGYHSFPYDLDGDGSTLEIVAGNTVYTHTGGLYCTLGDSSGGWTPARDGYPAVADLVGADGLPELVLTGNNFVGLYEGQPDSNSRCQALDRIANDPHSDLPDLPTHPLGCDTGRRSFGGQPTVADFDGDGAPEIGVAGACYYTVYDASGGQLSRYAMYPTRDWSSASTGSTVFDFNGDGAAEVVFSDENAVYVWGVDTRSGLDPWERLVPYLEDENHKSWTIHEYPLVADVDGDGKAEIVAVNGPRPDSMDEYGVYVLGAADDDWVSARPHWNQHAYHVTNIDDDSTIGTASPNYSPYHPDDLNSFRQQAPGAFGALAAPDLLPQVSACQEDCGDLTLWIQLANQADFITASPGLWVSVYGMPGDVLIDTQQAPAGIAPAELTSPLELIISGWGAYTSLRVVVDDPSQGGSLEWGAAKECNEDNNTLDFDLSGFCP